MEAEIGLLSDWRDLPELPKAAYRQKQEARMGCGVVVTIIGVCIMGTHSGVRLLSCKADGGYEWLLPLVYLEAVVALVCLAGLMFDDPGVIERSAETCTPVPEEIAAKLRDKVPLARSMQNLTSETDGRTYCVRCFVWRPPAPPAYDGMRFDDYSAHAHHCSTCQRCVVDFDHHCGVFGRCIAGKGLSGNFKYFSTIIVAGYAGAGTATGSLFLGVLKCSPGQWWGSWGNVVLVIFAGYVGIAALGWCVVATFQCVGYLCDVANDRFKGYELQCALCATCPKRPSRANRGRAARAGLELV